MSILTKISVVLLLVLVLLACPVFITQATQLPAYKDAYARQRTEIESIKQANRHLQLALTQAQEQVGRYADDIRELEVAKRLVELTLGTQIDDHVAANLGMSKTLAGLQANLDVLGQNMTKELARADKLADQLNESWKLTDELKKHIIDLNATVADKDVAMARLEATVRKLRMDIAQREREIADLVRRWAERDKPTVAVGPEDGVRPPVPMIRGTITAVDEDAASINIGSAKGIKKGMKLIVYRDGDGFVSYLQIELVDLNSAAGVVVSKRLGLEPRIDDKVKTR